MFNFTLIELKWLFKKFKICIYKKINREQEWSPSISYKNFKVNHNILFNRRSRNSHQAKEHKSNLTVNVANLK